MTQTSITYLFILLSISIFYNFFNNKIFRLNTLLLFSFIFFSGLIRKHYRLIAMSLVIIFLYGSMIWLLIPIEERISWEGHLSGFLVGIILAYLFRKKGIVKKEFPFSQTEFDSFFDEKGNLVENFEDINKSNQSFDE